MQHHLHPLALVAAAIPTALGAFHQHYAKVPTGWSAMNTVASSSKTVFTIALAMKNVDQLESKLLAVSTPGNAEYGQFLDADEVASQFGPVDGAVSAVTSWLESNGISDHKQDGLFLDFAADVGTVNALLNASYQYYENNGASKLRTLSYTIPQDVQDYITLVDPGIYFGGSKSAAPVPNPISLAPTKTRFMKRTGASTNTTVDPACSSILTPSCVKQLYNVGSYAPDAKSGSRVGFGSFLNQSALYADLTTFEKRFDIPIQNFTVEIIANGTNDQNPNTASTGEANLDVQNIVGVAHPLPVIEYSTGGSPPFIPTIDQPTAAKNQNEPYVPFYRYLLSKKNRELPQSISNSYADQEDGVPYNYAVLTCNLIGLMGLRGITIFESSGDGGLGDGCLAPDFKTVEFTPLFPPSCPYVTGVGGTVAVSPEIAWTGSGGGFSKYFPRPAYQDAAVAEYLKTVSPETYAYYGQYQNWSGRAIPDIAAHSLRPYYAIIYDGVQQGSGGTSGAAPVWAAIVGLLNDARFRAGKSQLGWLNPLLYTLGPQGLTDITEGYTIGCTGRNEPAGAGIVPGARFNATVGWDPTTGYGIPNFQKLKELVLSL